MYKKQGGEHVDLLLLDWPLKGQKKGQTNKEIHQQPLQLLKELENTMTIEAQVGGISIIT